MKKGREGGGRAATAACTEGLVLAPVAQVMQQHLLNVQLHVELLLEVDIRGIMVTLGPSSNVDDLPLGPAGTPQPLGVWAMDLRGVAPATPAALRPGHARLYALVTAFPRLE